MFLEIQDRPISIETKPKAKVSLKCLIAWLETKSGPYRPHDIGDCMFYQFARSAGFDHNVSYHMSFLMGESNMGNIAFERPHTYEAALERARGAK